MQIEDLKNLTINDGEIYFDYDLKKLNWFNIGGKAKIFFKANTLKGLIQFLKVYNNHALSYNNQKYHTSIVSQLRIYN